jgi:hypothetical protein
VISFCRLLIVCTSVDARYRREKKECNYSIILSNIRLVDSGLLFLRIFSIECLISVDEEFVSKFSSSDDEFIGCWKNN